MLLWKFEIFPLRKFKLFWRSQKPYAKQQPGASGRVWFCLRFTHRRPLFLGEKRGWHFDYRRVAIHSEYFYANARARRENGESESPQCASYTSFLVLLCFCALAWPYIFICHGAWISTLHCSDAWRGKNAGALCFRTNFVWMTSEFGKPAIASEKYMRRRRPRSWLVGKWGKEGIIMERPLWRELNYCSVNNKTHRRTAPPWTHQSSGEEFVGRCEKYTTTHPSHFNATRVLIAAARNDFYYTFGARSLSHAIIQSESQAAVLRILCAVRVARVSETNERCAWETFAGVFGLIAWGLHDWQEDENRRFSEFRYFATCRPQDMLAEIEIRSHSAFWLLWEKI